MVIRRNTSVAYDVALLSTTREDSIGDVFAWEDKYQLGFGAFGKVFKARCAQLPVSFIRHTEFSVGKTYAVKVVSKALLDTPEKILSVAREVDALRSLQNPNCVQLYDCFQDASNIYMVMELIQGCELLELVMKQGRLEEAQVKAITRQLLESVADLHRRRIVHRDLKLENILVNPETLQIKIIDFGCAKRFKRGGIRRPYAYGLVERLTSKLHLRRSSTLENDMTMTTGGAHLAAVSVLLSTPLGTEVYYSREILESLLSRSQNDALCGQKDVQKQDIFALGVNIYAMLGGVFPYNFRSREEHVRRINEGPQFPSQCFTNVSAEAQQFCAGLLQADSQHRPQAADCLKHPWLKHVRFSLETAGEATLTQKLVKGVPRIGVIRQLTTSDPASSSNGSDAHSNHKKGSSSSSCTHSANTDSIHSDQTHSFRTSTTVPTSSTSMGSDAPSFVDVAAGKARSEGPRSEVEGGPTTPASVNGDTTFSDSSKQIGPPSLDNTITATDSCVMSAALVKDPIYPKKRFPLPLRSSDLATEAAPTTTTSSSSASHRTASVLGCMVGGWRGLKHVVCAMKQNREEGLRPSVDHTSTSSYANNCNNSSNSKIIELNN